MYIETSSPRKPGENAKLVLTVPDNGKQSCLSFYYHMYGAAAGSLNVYNGNATIFNVSGDQGNNWHIVEKEVSLDREVSDFPFSIARVCTTDCILSLVFVNCLSLYIHCKARGRSQLSPFKFKFNAQRC